MPAQGETTGARGDTWHGVVNALGTVNKTPLFDSAVWIAELTWSHWNNVRSGGDLFMGLDYAQCKGLTKWDQCVTKDYVGTGVGFTPTWFQVLPGVDLQAPVTYAVGLKGNAATVFGGNQGLGNYTVGLGADVRQKYRFDLKYIDFVGRYHDLPNGTISPNGLTTFLKDRGFLSLTFKTTF